MILQGYETICSYFHGRRYEKVDPKRIKFQKIMMSEAEQWQFNWGTFKRIKL